MEKITKAKSKKVIVFFPPANTPKEVFARAEAIKNIAVTNPTISTGAFITSFT